MSPSENQCVLQNLHTRCSPVMDLSYTVYKQSYKSKRVYKSHKCTLHCFYKFPLLIYFMLQKILSPFIPETWFCAEKINKNSLFYTKLNLGNIWRPYIWRIKYTSKGMEVLQNIFVAFIYPFTLTTLFTNSVT